MDSYSIIRIAGFFVLVAAGETLNGIARTLFLNRRLGVPAAKRLSMIPALALCLLISWLYVPTLGISSDRGLVLLGMGLSLFMLAFDVVLGRFVARARWSAILGELNILRGNLLGVGMIVMAFCPLLSSKLPRLF